jgi:hypothetical protein
VGIKINRIELNGKGSKSSLAVLMYSGNENPVEALDKAVTTYVGDKEFYEFVDDNMDNPWTRVILKELDGFEKTEFIVEGRTFDLYKLHRSTNIEVAYLSYSKGTDLRPNPIMDFALGQFANGRGYNSFIDSDISDIWSRLVIIDINHNEWGQADFKDQRI